MLFPFGYSHIFYEKLIQNKGFDDLFRRFSQYPYINYYKVKLAHGIAIIRYKKNLPVHIESIKHDINLEQVNSPIFAFKYALKPNGLKIRNAGMVLINNFNRRIRSSYFDMI